MKYVFFSCAVFFFAQIATADQNPKLLKEISRKATFSLEAAHLNTAEDVEVYFKVCCKRILVLDMKGNDAELKKIVRKKLEQMRVNQEVNENTVYTYRFSFVPES